MFSGIGPMEIIFILLIVLVIFGPKRLPEMGKSVGKAIKEFKNAGKEIQQDIVSSLEEEPESKNKQG
ncbi:MAG: twin-arginine translocase TatA/TatE family subunit [Deltaproteobacteria bacterium]|nr:twin-arginine translocase TatA/TatE family subunit [Deltaproteobacteria bacterium]